MLRYLRNETVSPGVTAVSLHTLLPQPILDQLFTFGGGEGGGGARSSLDYSKLKVRSYGHLFIFGVCVWEGGRGYHS